MQRYLAEKTQETRYREPGGELHSAKPNAL
jgi:hypothetical protein